MPCLWTVISWFLCICELCLYLIDFFQGISTKGSSTCAPGTGRRAREASEVQLLPFFPLQHGVICLQRTSGCAARLQRNTFMEARQRKQLQRASERLRLQLEVQRDVRLGRTVRVQQGHFNSNSGFNASPQTSLSLEIMRFKRCTGRHESFLGCWLRKSSAPIKQTRRNSKRKLQKICPVSFYPSILTFSCHPDPCHPRCGWVLPYTGDPADWGDWPDTQSMKPTDNEIWPGFFKNKIRPASHLWPSYRPLRIESNSWKRTRPIHSCIYYTSAPEWVHDP